MLLHHCPRGLIFTWLGLLRFVSFDINQPNLSTPYSALGAYFCPHSHCNYISFHKFSRQLSAFTLCSSGLISALLVISTVYLFLIVSLTRFRDPA